MKYLFYWYRFIQSFNIREFIETSCMKNVSYSFWALFINTFNINIKRLVFIESTIGVKPVWNKCDWSWINADIFCKKINVLKEIKMLKADHTMIFYSTRELFFLPFNVSIIIKSTSILCECAKFVNFTLRNKVWMMFFIDFYKKKILSCNDVFRRKSWIFLHKFCFFPSYFNTIPFRCQCSTLFICMTFLSCRWINYISIEVIPSA